MMLMLSWGLEKDPEMMKELHIADNQKVTARVAAVYPNEKTILKGKTLSGIF